MQTSRLLIACALAAALGVAQAQEGPDVAGLIAQGQSLAADGKLDQALEALQQAIAADPRSSLAYTRLGGVQVLRQEYSDGIRSFQQAVMLDQGNANAFVGMAVAYLHMGDYALARQALLEAEQRDPSKKPEIGKVLAWVDQRSAPPGH